MHNATGPGMTTYCPLYELLARFLEKFRPARQIATTRTEGGSFPPFLSTMLKSFSCVFLYQNHFS